MKQVVRLELSTNRRVGSQKAGKRPDSGAAGFQTIGAACVAHYLRLENVDKNGLETTTKSRVRGSMFSRTYFEGQVNFSQHLCHVVRLGRHTLPEKRAAATPQQVLQGALPALHQIWDTTKSPSRVFTQNSLLLSRTPGYRGP